MKFSIVLVLENALIFIFTPETQIATSLFSLEFFFFPMILCVKCPYLPKYVAILHTESWEKIENSLKNK